MAEGHFIMPEHLRQAAEGRKERQERMEREEAQLADLIAVLDRGRQAGTAQQARNGKTSNRRF